MNVYDVIKILGIITLVMLSATFIFGFFKINVKNRFQIHKWLGIITLLLAVTHGFIVFYVNYIK